MKQEMIGWQWHDQLDHTQVICTLLQRDNHASTTSLTFYRTDALPDGDTQPSSNCVTALKAAFQNWLESANQIKCAVQFRHKPN